MQAKRKNSLLVEIIVSDFKRNLLQNAEVSLKSLDQKKAEIYKLKYDKRTRSFREISVKPGRYMAMVDAEGYQPDKREIQVGPSRAKEFFFLGKKGMPFYYNGRVKIPFESKDDLLGLSLKSKLSTKEEQELNDFALKLQLQPEEVGRSVLEDNIRVFRFKEKVSKNDVLETQQRLGEHPMVRFVGPIVQMTREQVTFLTNELIVKFKSHVTREEIPKIASSYNLNVIRAIRYAGNAFLLRSDGPASYDLLTVCDEIVRNESVEYAEHNLVITVKDLQINPTDYLYPEQWHIPLIHLPDAWQELRNANSPGVIPGDSDDLTYGSPEVIIAVLDRGIESQTVMGLTSSSHPDFNGQVTSGQDKVCQFYDFANMVDNNDNPPNNHGMGCSGVATALANNNSPIAGINEGVVGAAPNCRVMGLIRPTGTTTQRYADAFIWIAGFDPGWTIDGTNYLAGTVFPPPPSPSADIISCSFGWQGWPISELMMDTMDFITTYGRSGKGALIFIAVGNDDDDYHGEQGLAVHPKTMAVAASSLANDAVTEVRATYSNFGDGIDFCAPSNDERVGVTTFHNPPNNYGIISGDFVGEGNMPGHPVTQTALSQAAAAAPFTTLTGPVTTVPDWVNPGTATLDVDNNAGFAVNQWIRLGQHRDPIAEWVRITAIPAGGNQITVTATTNGHPLGTPIIGVTTLDVNNNAGLGLADEWVLIGQPGQAGTESVLIRDVPAGNTQVRVAGPLNNHAVNSQVIAGPNNYRNGFGGTSSATPLVAGVAALMLSVNPDLSWVQARQILRNTAIKIDLANVDPIGQWQDTTGDGNPDYSEWYGYGRIDALAAIQAAVNLVGVTPQNNIDTWIMENSTDVGDVPVSPPWISPDVWVRNVDPAIDLPAEVTQHQSPIRGQDNWVYINLRNRGVVDSLDVYVRVFITRWAGTQYIYPDDFIPTNNPGTIPTPPLEPGTYKVGEAHIETIPAGGVVTINMKWESALIPPASVTIDGVIYSWADACLLVDVSPHDGPTPTGINTWDNNNLCQRNVFPVDPDADDDFAIGFVVGHQANRAKLINLRIERRNLPPDVELYLDYIDKDTTKEVIKVLERTRAKPHRIGTCELALLKEAEGKVHCSKTEETYSIIIPTDTSFSFPCCRPFEGTFTYKLKTAVIKDRTIFGIPTVQRAYVPIPRKRGEYKVVALVGKGLKKLKQGKYQLEVYQEDLTGRIKGGFNFIFNVN
ncbi:MAG: S8 family serine peptidase [Candidatus Thorarchaeota archaeon]|jgi:hypothetical protein